MPELEMTVHLRNEKGKGVARRLRRQGLIPGILYGKGENLSLAVDSKTLLKTIHGGAGENTIFQLNIEGEPQADRKVIVREVQYHPFSQAPLHVDLFEIAMDREITVRVPVITLGDPIGVLDRGGVLNHLLHEVEIECLPGLIPEEISLDVSLLDVGDALYIKDLPVQEGVRILADSDEAVVIVTGPTVEKEERAEEEVPEQPEKVEG